MSATGTAHRCNAWKSLTPAAVKAACGLLTTGPSLLALDGSLPHARLLSPSRRPYLIRDATLSAVLDRARLVYAARTRVLSSGPGMFGDPADVVLARAMADGVDCGDSAGLIEGTRFGEVASVGPLKAGSCR